MEAAVAELPSGTVTLLFTDVDRSTELVKALGERYGEVLSEHRRLLRTAFAEFAGSEVDTQGDAFFVAFPRARNALAAAIAGQRALETHEWPEGAALRVRIGLHTGEPHPAEHGYVGVGVHRAARICSIAHGGQILLSRATAGIADDETIAGVDIRDLGEHPLKDFERPERLFQLVVEGLQSDFPPLRSVGMQIPLTGTMTVAFTDLADAGRLDRELSPEDFGALLVDYQRLAQRVFEETGGREIQVAFDSVMAAFPTAGSAARAALKSQQALAAHDRRGARLSMSVALHAGRAGVGWAGPAVLRAAEISELAPRDQIVLSQAAASLLEDEGHDDLALRDLGEMAVGNSGRTTRLYELVVA